MVAQHEKEKMEQEERERAEKERRSNLAYALSVDFPKKLDLDAATRLLEQANWDFAKVQNDLQR